MLIEIALIGGLALVGLLIVAHAGLRGWQDWLDLRRFEIEQAVDPGMALTIDMASLRERLRQLEVRVESGTRA